MPDRHQDRGRGAAPQRWSWAAAIWFAAGACGLALLAYVAAHLPRKPIGLLALAFGTLAAWGLLRLAGELRLPAGRRLLVATAVLILAGQVTIALESHRVFAGSERQRWGPDPAAWIREGLERQSARAPDSVEPLPESNERERLLQHRTSFSAYLRFRLSNVGSFDSGSPWPALIWGLEVLVGTAAGLRLGQRIARRFAPKPIAPSI